MDEENLVNQLRHQNLHLESALQLANAQLSVGKLDLRSMQKAYEEAVGELVSHQYDTSAREASLWQVIFPLRDASQLLQQFVRL